MKEKNIVVLRSVYGKVEQEYILNPCVSRETGMLPPHVKQVDAHGDMIISDKELQSGKIFIPITEAITIKDGTTFDLNNPLQAARWEAIKDSQLIAPERSATDEKGNYLIDGDYKHYGRAVLYIERPGVEAEKRVNKSKLINKALNFIYQDTLENQLLRCKLLGRNMQGSYQSDVEEFLTEYAKRNPQKIIDLYTGSDTEIRLLFQDALQSGVIREKQGVYLYGDKVVLGATDDAAIAFFKQPQNKRVVDLITADVYPEYQVKEEKTSTKK